jgi:hypothetical protein
MEPRWRSDPGFGSGPPRYPGTFLLAFREALAELGWKADRWLGDAVACLDAEGTERLVGLENLYRRVRGSDRSGWPAAVAEFLTTALGSDIDETLPTNLVEAADQLMIRLGPPLRGESDEARLWAQPLDETGLVVNLVIDYPDRMVYVSEAMIAESGKPGEEWKNTALGNLREQTPEDCLQVIHEESGLLMCNVADAYDSSRALLLDQLVPQSEQYGCFVALSNRDHLLVLPVSQQALAFVGQLKIFSERNFKTEPYPICPEVFWVHEGHWRLFGIEVKGDRALLNPPAEFAELLQDLMPPEAESADED